MSTNKAFTLVELLAVVVILGIILSITVPKIKDVIDSVGQSLYQVNERTMVSAARNYLIMNEISTPSNIGDTIVINMDELKENKLMSDIFDVKDENTKCVGYIIVLKSSETSYEFTPYLECGVNYVSQTIITNGLVLDMPLGDYKDGDTYIDRSGNNNHGTNYGGILVENRLGIYNKATSFSNINSYVNVLHSESINIKDELTVSCWVKMYSLDGVYKNLVVKGNEGSQFYWLYIGGNNSIRGRVRLEGQSYSNNVTTAIPINEWMNIAYTYDGNYIKVYKDGLMIGSPYPATGKIDATTASLRIAHFQVWWDTTLAWNFNGVIDDVLIYNRALTTDEIKHNYNLGNKWSD